MNVGFNKGYNFAIWLNVFAPSVEVNIPAWYRELKTVSNVSMLCGACGDCHTPPVVSPHMGQPIPHIHFVGVDLNKANILTVRQVIAQLNKTQDLSQVKLDLVHAAAGVPSSEPGSKNTLKIPVCPNGNEICKIPDDPAKLDPNQVYEDVPLVSVDGLVHELHFLKASHSPDMHTHYNHHPTPLIDILHIDTEGNDAEVIKSTAQLLRARKIRALIFEYHWLLPWGVTKLREVTELLNQQGMECYLCGQNRLWPITGECWGEQYEFHEWSNVLCVLRTDPWQNAIEPLVQTVSRIHNNSPLLGMNGSVVNIHGMKDIFLLKNGKRHGFKNWDAFTSRGYHNSHVKKFHDFCGILQVYPEGELLN